MWLPSDKIINRLDTFYTHTKYGKWQHDATLVPHTPNMGRSHSSWHQPYCILQTELPLHQYTEKLTHQTFRQTGGPLYTVWMPGHGEFLSTVVIVQGKQALHYGHYCLVLVTLILYETTQLPVYSGPNTGPTGDHCCQVPLSYAQQLSHWSSLTLLIMIMIYVPD